MVFGVFQSVINSVSRLFGSGTNNKRKRVDRSDEQATESSFDDDEAPESSKRSRPGRIGKTLAFRGFIFFFSVFRARFCLRLFCRHAEP